MPAFALRRFPADIRRRMTRDAVCATSVCLLCHALISTGHAASGDRPPSAVSAGQTPVPAGSTSRASALAALRAAFAQRVLKPTTPDPARLHHLLEAARTEFALAGQLWPVDELFLLVDRHPQSQEALVALAQAGDTWEVIGSAKVSTGRPGRFDYYCTPTGLFEHGVATGSFRAEGTFNDSGIRGYGLAGMRIFDLGWVSAIKGWGSGGVNTIRLQVHATDPVLEQRLGQPASKGCIRVDSGLNRFLDQYAVLDAGFEALFRETGQRPWFWLADRSPTPWSGRWVVVVDLPPSSQKPGPE